MNNLPLPEEAQLLILKPFVSAQASNRVPKLRINLGERVDNSTSKKSKPKKHKKSKRKRYESDEEDDENDIASSGSDFDY